MDAKNNQKPAVAPNSIESERMVLGCMLTSLNSFNIAADGLDIDDFYYKEHKTVFGVLKNSYKSDKPVDTHLVCEELKRMDNLDKIGGVGYITSLAQYAGTSAYIEEYVELIKNKSILRKMITASQKTIEKALSDPVNVPDELDDAQSRLFYIGQDFSKETGVQLKDFLLGSQSASKLPYIEELQKRQAEFLEKGEDYQEFTGMPTHFSDLDKMTNGLTKSNLIILASRPAMGKTALAMNIAENVCFRNNVPVGIFSLEMSAEQLLHRLICSQTEVESQKIRTGSVSGNEYQHIVSKVNDLVKHTMIIDDQPGLRITDLRARARRMVETHRIEFLVVDYLQLISVSNSGNRSDNRQQEISEISRMLKNLARELNIPILCLSQLSRKVEDREGHRPMMSDLRESGAIEQDADIVMFLLRSEYYNANNKPGAGEIIIGKNRHGGTGTVNVTFLKSIAKFYNYSYEKEDEDTNNDFSAFSPTSTH